MLSFFRDWIFIIIVLKKLNFFYFYLYSLLIKFFSIKENDMCFMKKYLYCLYYIICKINYCDFCVNLWELEFGRILWVLKNFFLLRIKRSKLI